MVHEGGSMIQAVLAEVRQFLTINAGDNSKRIVDVEFLLQRHSVDEVIDFLKSYLREKEHTLRNMILIDKSHRKVDEIVASMFRIHMAIKTLEDGNTLEIQSREKEVKTIVGLKRGTAKGSKLFKGNCSGNISSRSRKNQNHDGENRDTGENVPCAA